MSASFVVVQVCAGMAFGALGGLDASAHGRLVGPLLLHAAMNVVALV